MKNVSIIGSGNVGVNSAFFIAEQAAAHVTLVDIQEGISEGKALDMMEAAPIRGYRTRIKGASDINAIEGSDVVVIAAGLIRTPGHDRGEHFKENELIAKDLCASIVKLAPDAIVLVATEPVDAMVQVVVKETGFDRKRVMGIGGLLDSTRMAHFVADEMGVSARDVTAMVIGSHTEKMVPLPEFTRINGIPIDQLVPEEMVTRIVDETREAGEVIVDLSKRSNAYYAPSAAIAKVVEAICIDTHSILPMSIMLLGEYGVEGVSLSVPCKVGANGVEEILDVSLADNHLEAFRASAEPVRSYF